MAEIKEIKQISVNGTLYSIGGGNDSPFTLTEKNGAQMSACTASGQYAVAEGSGTTASGNYSHAEGWDTSASGYFSHAEGRGTLASDYFSHAEGGFTTASTYASHAEGDNTKAIGHSSHAEGNNTTASGIYSHAEGKGTSATTQSEHASGQYNVSLSGSSDWGYSGNTLFTVGNGYQQGQAPANTHNALQIMQDGTIYISDTSGEGKYYQKPMIKLQDALKNSGGGTGGDSPFIKADNGGAYMSGCTASGQNAVAEGNGTNASGNYSHVEGAGTTASGTCSHAEGYDTSADGSYSHAEGEGTSAVGKWSHAEGVGTTASGQQSHAEGYSTSATTECEHASGQYNISLSGSSTWGDSGNTLFTVGNGYATGSTVTTHNALQIMQNGDIYIANTNAEGEYYQKPMIKLQDVLANSGGDVDLQALINRISELETKVATLMTKSEVEKGFNNVITVVDNNKLKIRNNALEDESTD